MPRRKTNDPEPAKFVPVSRDRLLDWCNVGQHEGIGKYAQCPGHTAITDCICWCHKRKSSAD